MKNKKKYPFIIIFLLFCSIIIYLLNENHSLKESSNNYENNKVLKKKNMLSMMLETAAGSGNYEMTSRSEYPTNGYEFNEELSRCENGSTLSWDDTKKAVIVSGSTSDRCYVYFDVYVESIADYCDTGTDLATCVKNFGDQGSAISNIYIHNSSLENGAGDNSYRYAGASDAVNNYVCFGSSVTPCPADNLYRIIGVFGENNHGVTGKRLVKLIKYDYANSNLLGTDGDYEGTRAPNSPYYKGSLSSINTYYWNYKNNTKINDGFGSNTWSTSLLNKINLNTNYLNNIGTTWSNLIEDATWKVSGHSESSVTPSEMYTGEITDATKTYGPSDGTSKIGLVYASDYGFAASPSAWAKTLVNYDGKDANGTSIKTINWMYMGDDEWTISPSSSDSNRVFYLFRSGYVSRAYAHNNYTSYSSRPVLYLKASVLYAGGSGTKDSPITLVV